MPDHLEWLAALDAGPQGWALARAVRARSREIADFGRGGVGARETAARPVRQPGARLPAHTPPP